MSKGNYTVTTDEQGLCLCLFVARPEIHGDSRQPGDMLASDYSTRYSGFIGGGKRVIRHCTDYYFPLNYLRILYLRPEHCSSQRQSSGIFFSLDYNGTFESVIFLIT